jgi:hypothetical protein
MLIKVVDVSGKKRTGIIESGMVGDAFNLHKIWVMRQLLRLNNNHIFA